MLIWRLHMLDAFRSVRQQKVFNRRIWRPRGQTLGARRAESYSNITVKINYRFQNLKSQQDWPAWCVLKQF
jgi:hypothetical protein